MLQESVRPVDALHLPNYCHFVESALFLQKVKDEANARLKRLDQFGRTDVRSTAVPKSLSRKDVEIQRRKFGPYTRFGEGDGSYWDRWLTKSAVPRRATRPASKMPPAAKASALPIQTKDKEPSTAERPSKSVHRIVIEGTVMPQRGFKAAFPERYHLPSHLIEEDRRRRAAQQEKTLTDLLADDVMLRTKEKKNAFANASKAAAQTIENVRAASRRNLLEAAKNEQLDDSKAGGFSGPDNDKANGGRMGGRRRRPLLQTDKAKAAALRFQERVEASISNLTSECRIPLDSAATTSKDAD